MLLLFRRGWAIPRVAEHLERTTMGVAIRLSSLGQLGYVGQLALDAEEE